MLVLINLTCSAACMHARHGECAPATAPPRARSWGVHCLHRVRHAGRGTAPGSRGGRLNDPAAHRAADAHAERMARECDSWRSRHPNHLRIHGHIPWCCKDSGHTNIFWTEHPERRVRRSQPWKYVFSWCDHHDWVSNNLIIRSLRKQKTVQFFPFVFYDADRHPARRSSLGTATVLRTWSVQRKSKTAKSKKLRNLFDPFCLISPDCQQHFRIILPKVPRIRWPLALSNPALQSPQLQSSQQCWKTKWIWFTETARMCTISMLLFYWTCHSIKEIRTFWPCGHACHGYV